MSPYAPLIERCDRLRDAVGWSESTLSNKLFKDSKRLGLLREGKDVTVTTFNAALRKLDQLEAKHGVTGAAA